MPHLGKVHTPALPLWGPDHDSVSVVSMLSLKTFYRKRARIDSLFIIKENLTYSLVLSPTS